MEYRKLGKWGLKVSELAVGSWLTDLTDKPALEVAEQTIDLAMDAGINFYDCADAYSGGDAEVFLGRALKKQKRSDLVVSSKCFFPMGDGPNDRGLSRKHIMESIDGSLKRLDMDYVDLYYCHRPDPDTPLEETIQAMSDLITAGKVLYWGVSEWTPAQLAAAVEITKQPGMRPLSVLQPQYNMFDRYIETEILPFCREAGIGVTPFSPLSQGLLTGKYRKGQPIPEGSRATWQADAQINALLTDENLDKVEELVKVADGVGCTLAQLALAWILREPQISSVITGSSKPSQLESNLKAQQVKLDAATLATIEEILDFHPEVRSIG